MELFTIKGKLTTKTPVSTGMGKNGEWRKITFVINCGARDKMMAITAWHAQCDQIEQTPIGSELSVACDVSSREYNGKWYTDVTAKSIEGDLFVPAAKVEDQKPLDDGDDFMSNNAPKSAEPEKSSFPKSTTSNPDIDTSDLPF